MYDMFDDELLFEEALDDVETTEHVELEAALEIVDIQLEAEVEKCGGSCKGKKGCKESDDDLDDDVDDVEEALDLLEAEW